MKLEQQVIPLDLAKRLKALGVKQEAYFWYFDDGELGHYANSAPLYAAFTTSELGEMLKDDMECIWFPEHKKWGCFQTLGTMDTIYAKTEAEARGLMLEYLLTNKLMSV